VAVTLAAPLLVCNTFQGLIEQGVARLQ